MSSLIKKLRDKVVSILSPDLKCTDFTVHSPHTTNTNEGTVHYAWPILEKEEKEDESK